MQLIDGKGRIFGTINIIDLTVLLFIISAISGFAWLYYTGELFRDHDPAKRYYSKKEVQAVLLQQPPSTLISINDELKKIDGANLSSIQLLEITSFNHTIKTIKQGSIEVQKTEGTYDIFVKIDIPIKIDKYTGIAYYYDSVLWVDFPVIIGGKFNLTMGNTTIPFIITNTT